MKKLGLFPLLLTLVACTSVAPPRVTSGAAALDPEKAWANVLQQSVDDKGRINFAGVAAHPEDLDAYVAWVATKSPVSDPAAFPTRESQLAYYLNTYNALAMYNAIRSGIPPELDSIKVKFFGLTSFQIGGKKMSLNTLETKVVRPMGDPRVHMALNCMVRGCPRLPREPFRAELLDAQLEASTRYFFNETRNVQVDAEKQTVRFSQILQFYTEDFLKKAPSLIAFANQYREEKLPEGLKVEFIPYDWKLNSQ